MTTSRQSFKRMDLDQMNTPLLCFFDFGLQIVREYTRGFDRSVLLHVCITLLISWGHSHRGLYTRKRPVEGEWWLFYHFVYLLSSSVSLFHQTRSHTRRCIKLIQGVGEFLADTIILLLH